MKKLIILLLCSFVQFLSAAHPAYNSIKFVLMKVGEGKISLDVALDKIMDSDLKKKIICDTYEEDVKDFFYRKKEHLDLFYKKSKFTEYTADASESCITAHNMVQLYAADQHVYTQLTNTLFDDELRASPPLFMHGNNLTQHYLFGYGGKRVFFFTRTKASKSLHVLDIEYAEEIGIRACAPYNKDGLLFIGHKNIYIQPATEAGALSVIKLPDDFPIITTLTDTDLPHLFVGITSNDSVYCIIRIKKSVKQNSSDLKLTWKCIGAEPGIIAIGTRGCGIYLHRAGGDSVSVPYTLADNERIRNFDFSIAQANLLYTMIQDQKHGRVTVTPEERATIEKLIPDMYQKTLWAKKS